MTIDVNIQDYSQDTVERFSLLFASLPTDGFQAQSMKILQQAFENDGKEDEFEYFVASTIMKQKMFADADDKDKPKGENDPVIQPTDLI